MGARAQHHWPGVLADPPLRRLGLFGHLFPAQLVGAGVGLAIPSLLGAGTRPNLSRRPRLLGPAAASADTAAR